MDCINCFIFKHYTIKLLLENHGFKALLVITFWDTENTGSWAARV